MESALDVQIESNHSIKRTAFGRRLCQTLGLTRKSPMPGWPIPAEFPLNELVGQEVTQICIGFAQVQIHLYRQPQPGTPDKWKPGARIDVESAFTLEEGDSGLSRVEPQMFKLAGGQLTKLLGEKISEVHPEQGNELRLRFSKGMSLRLHTDPQGFESFHLHVSGESTTVTSA